ncbi:MAG: hypothetical protein ACYCS0_00925 [bacterium]
MSSNFDTKEHFILQLSGKIKSYILSIKPAIIESSAFVKHIYYYAFFEYVKKYEDKLRINKTEMMTVIEKAFLLAVSQITFYKYQAGRYLLCEHL